MFEAKGITVVDRNWKLSPSDFAFLWEECPRCFYLKVRQGFFRPRTPMPRIFIDIDSAMKNCFEGARAEALAEGIPPGVVKFGEKWVESKPIIPPGSRSTCFVRGKFDTVIQFDDSSYGVIDFKTSKVSPQNVAKYGRQLHAYAHALENAAPRKFALQPISKLGLLVFEPAHFSNEESTASLSGRLSWLEIPRDAAAFLDFLGQVVGVLGLPEPPVPSPYCEWCRYREEQGKIPI